MNENLDVPMRSSITIAEAAVLLQLTDQSVRRRAKAGDFGAFRHGRSWVLDRDEVIAESKLRGTIRTVPHVKPSQPKGKICNLSFFSGAMGLDLGFERAGIETILACESEKWCRATIARNRPDLPLLGDVAKLSAADVREAAGLEAGEEIDVISGGPPCQAFSTAGARRGFSDPRGNVFLQFLDLVAELEPRYLVIENVRGLLSAPLEHRPHSERGDSFAPLAEEERPGGALEEVIRTLTAAGYRSSFNLYNAANFGTPQVRERVVILASRSGERIPHLTPTHSNDPAFGLEPWLTFRDAVSDLDESVVNSLEFPESRLKYYRLLKPGEYWRHLPEELQKEALGKSFYSGGGKTGFLRRLAWDKPSPTVLTHPAMPATDLAHPEADRPLSIEEYKRIQQFPDDWILEGNLTAKYKQVGNAVPVGLGEAIGKAVLDHDQGIVNAEHPGFPYSRYKKNCDRTWGGPEVVSPTSRQLALI
ncbi:MAG: DNA cytosine methyltransferase [Solirubrobacterales bacterium]